VNDVKSIQPTVRTCSNCGKFCVGREAKKIAAGDLCNHCHPYRLKLNNINFNLQEEEEIIRNAEEAIRHAQSRMKDLKLQERYAEERLRENRDQQHRILDRITKLQ